MTEIAIRNPAIIEEAIPYGPALSRLSPMKQRFVLALLADDRNNGADAAAAAGYAPDNRDSQKSIGSRLRHDPEVLAAIGEVARSQLFSLRGKAVRTLQYVLDDPNAKPSEKIKAAREVMDRTDLIVHTEQKITVEHTVAKDLKGQIEEILSLCVAANRDPRAVMGPDYFRKAVEFGLVTDAEFTEVPPEIGPGSGMKKGLPVGQDMSLTISESVPPKRAPAMSFVGLEDVL